MERSAARRTRRGFLRGSLALAGLGLLLSCGLPAPAHQPSRVPRIGLLSINVDAPRAAYIEAFRQRLRELGYLEGRDLTIEIREAQGDDARLPALASELVGLGVALIVAGSSPETQAAQGVTRTVPIVMMNSADPVAQGLVASLNRPGGNVTGLTNISRQVVPKRLELLKETVPGLARAAVIWNPGNPAKPIEFADLQSTAATLRIDLRSLEIRSPGEVEQAVGTAARDGAEGLLVLGDPLTGGQAPRIASAVQAHRLPAIHEVRPFVAAGGLMAYGASIPDQWRRGAAYVDKILKGANPADLPVEQPTTFDLVINLKTAQALGLTIPESVLQQATEVIQ